MIKIRQGWQGLERGQRWQWRIAKGGDSSQFLKENGNIVQNRWEERWEAKREARRERERGRDMERHLRKKRRGMRNGKLNERREVERKVEKRERKLGLGGKSVQLCICLFSFQNWNSHTDTYWIKINIWLYMEWIPFQHTGHSSLLCMYLCASNHAMFSVRTQYWVGLSFFPYPPGSSASSPPY